MSSGGFTTIEVVNWDKYQIRKDIKSMNYFRVQAALFSDSMFRELSSAGKLIWVCLLCECALRNNKEITFSDRVITELCKVRTKSVQSALDDLEQFQMIRVLSRNGHVPIKKEIKKEYKGAPLKIVDHQPAAKPKKKTEPKEKFKHPTTFEEFENLFTQDVIDHWLSLYDGDLEWLKIEQKKAYGYFYVEKTKPPSASIKGWNKRMGSWLARGWEQRARYKSNRGVSSAHEDDPFKRFSEDEMRKAGFGSA